MNRWLPRWCVAGLVLAWVVTGSWFQLGVASAQPNATIDAEELRITALDASSTPGVLRVQVATPRELIDASLDEDSVEVLINGTDVAATIAPITSSGIGVTLVIDTSGSMKGVPLASAKRAAADFLATLPSDAKVSVISFGAEAELVHAGTDPRSQAAIAIDGLAANGETALHDAIALGLDTQSQVRRPVMVVLSDGGDTASDITFEELMSAVGRSDFQIETIALSTEESDAEALVSVAAATAGEMVTASEPDALDELYAEISRVLVAEYEIVAPIEGSGSVPVEIRIEEGAVAASVQFDASLAPSVLPRAAVVPDQPAALALSTPQPGVLSHAMAPWVGASSLLASIAAGIAWLLTRRQPDPYRRFGPKVDTPTYGASGPMAALRQQAISLTDRLVERSNARVSLADKLDQAGLRVRSGEFVLAAVAAAILGFLLVSLTMGIVPGLGAGVIGMVVPGAWLLVRTHRRKRAFQNQLPEIIGLMANTVRAGYSLPQAVTAIAAEVEEPAYSEFRRAQIEVRLGSTLTDALKAMADRMGSVDFVWVADAIDINASVGGDLVEVLENVASTIRERVRLKAQINALTAEGKLSALVLFSLPPGVGVLITILNPEYFEGIFDTPTGFAIVGVGVGLVVVGGIWLQKLISGVTP